MKTQTANNQKNDNPFWNLLFNIVIPILVLNKLSQSLGAMLALALALSAPLIYLIWDLWKKKKFNVISILGILNVGMTGGLAVLKLEGPWFWVKEALFPLLVGSFVLFSTWSKNPFVKTLLFNPQALDLVLIEAKVAEHRAEGKLESLLKNTTLWLSFSFLVSALLNFVLAQRIFVAIDTNLDIEARAQILNNQIAEMTKLSFPVIFLPSMLILVGILFFLFKKLRELTGLTTEELFPKTESVSKT